MGELGHHVAAAVAHERLEQPRRERLELGPHGVDARLREQRVDERAVDAVLRRIELEREQRIHARLRRGMSVVPATAEVNALAVERRGRHVVIAGEHPEPAVQVRVTSGCSSRIGPNTLSGSRTNGGS